MVTRTVGQRLDRVEVRRESAVLPDDASGADSGPDTPFALTVQIPLYRFGETNHCPGCGRTHWLIGRRLAECAFCATALPLKEA